MPRRSSLAAFHLEWVVSRHVGAEGRDRNERLAGAHVVAEDHPGDPLGGGVAARLQQLADDVARGQQGDGVDLMLLELTAFILLIPLVEQDAVDHLLDLDDPGRNGVFQRRNVGFASAELAQGGLFVVILLDLFEDFVDCVHRRFVDFQGDFCVTFIFVIGRHLVFVFVSRSNETI